MRKIVSRRTIRKVFQAQRRRSGGNRQGPSSETQVSPSGPEWAKRGRHSPQRQRCGLIAATGARPSRAQADHPPGASAKLPHDIDGGNAKAKCSAIHRISCSDRMVFACPIPASDVPHPSAITYRLKPPQPAHHWGSKHPRPWLTCDARLHPGESISTLPCRPPHESLRRHGGCGRPGRT